jgi:hypothetical protein
MSHQSASMKFAVQLSLISDIILCHIQLQARNLNQQCMWSYTRSFQLSYQFHSIHDSKGKAWYHSLSMISLQSKDQDIQHLSTGSCRTAGPVVAPLGSQTCQADSDSDVQEGPPYPALAWLHWPVRVRACFKLPVLGWIWFVLRSHGHMIARASESCMVLRLGIWHHELVLCHVQMQFVIGQCCHIIKLYHRIHSMVS